MPGGVLLPEAPEREALASPWCSGLGRHLAIILKDRDGPFAARPGRMSRGSAQYRVGMVAVDEPGAPSADVAPVALTIAGSDSGGGAGIAADLKAFARCGVHGTMALTAVTAQSTVGVSAVHEIPSEMVLAQVSAVVGDLGVRAVKVGMLGGAKAARAVAEALAVLDPAVPVVVDPVMVSSSGQPLLAAAARDVLVEQILPRATVVTPNLDEARALVTPGSRADRGEGQGAAEGADGEPADAQHRALLAALLALGPGAVVLTGGHGGAGGTETTAPVVDLFAEAARPGVVVPLVGARARSGGDHGSGCTHAALIAAQLALGRSPLAAARRARELTGRAIAEGQRGLGGGPGPVDVLGLARLRAEELEQRP